MKIGQLKQALDIAIL